MRIFKAKDISKAEKKAICKRFGVPYPQDVTRYQLEHYANSKMGIITILRIRLYNQWEHMVEEFKNGKARAQQK